MKYLLILCISAVTFGADEKPVSAEEKLSIRNAQVELIDAQRQFEAVYQAIEQEVQQRPNFLEAKAARDKAQNALNAARAKVLNDHKCNPPQCTLDEKTLDMTKPAAPAPQPTKPAK